MGKPYEKEIGFFNHTYEWALNTDIDELISFVRNSSKIPLYIVGSGGSFTATTFTSMLHQQNGTISKCLTPLEFSEYSNIERNSSILILTAGGNNKDILSAFEKAISVESEHLGIISASKNNKLTKKAQKFSRVYITQHVLPTKKDGFLATNSLIATTLWILRAYKKNFSSQIPIPENLSCLIYGDSDELKFKEQLQNKFKHFQKTNSIIVLYDNWGKTAAVDTESKLIESGLVNVQLADYRNFAHGRHNWLDKNQNSSGIITLINPHCRKIAHKTIDLIPKNIPIAEISTEFSGDIGALALLIKMMHIIPIFGSFRKIDPGNPGVANFGRRIYHLAPQTNEIKTKIMNPDDVIIKRKFGKHLSTDLLDKKIPTLRKFRQTLSNTNFDAVIFDYDGTLCDAVNRFKQPSSATITCLLKLLQEMIPIGIATGRGKSVRHELQKTIPKVFWPNIHIGYYNCSDIGTLNEDNKPDSESETHPNLVRFLNYMKEVQLLNEQTDIDIRPKQISITRSFSALDLVGLLNTLNPEILNNVKIVESTHSLDVISKDVSKLDLLSKFQKELNLHNVLCIGDRGIWPGNDFELLHTPYSLSVDATSPDPNSCWNLAPLGHKGEQATQDYVNSMIIHEHRFKLDVNNMGYDVK